ncbi:uncharacterized protein SAPINGB_P001054 [Magnusiomyces paraingens]|uniref:Uncharacterized protein n=1 Tax=Magnusiomyces paraingens TaxID=2606893 RepID=A0A5E8B3S8_9ASCO|nr:uncharacterized protein SAPINGB_P001054 [Saprochaete ingens]VVT46116.1 unnamed protein product [Saprochaete ingens]
MTWPKYSSNKSTGLRAKLFSKKKDYNKFTDAGDFFPKHLASVKDVFGNEPATNPFEDPSTVYDSEDEELNMKIMAFQARYKIVESPFSDYVSERSSVSSTISPESAMEKKSQNPFSQKNEGFETNFIITPIDSIRDFPSFSEESSSRNKNLEIVDPSVFCYTDDDESYMATFEVKKPKTSLKAKFQRTFKKVFHLTN